MGLTPSYRLARAVLTAAVLAGPAVPAAAQTAPAQTPPALDLRPGQIVRVTMASGREHEGRVVALSPDLRLESGGALPWPDIGFVQTDVRDPLADGVRKGAIAGGVSAGGFGAFIAVLVCAFEECGSDAIAIPLLWAGIGAGGGAALGAAIDGAVLTRAVIYPAATRVPRLDVDIGERVWVATRDGAQLDGRVLAASTSTLDLAIAGARTSVSMDRIRTIAAVRPDGLGDGAVRGMLLGAGGVAGTLFVGQLADGACCEPLTILFWSAGAAGAGALAGAGIDALIKARPIVYRSAGERAATIRLAPIVRQRGGGLGVSIRW